VSDSKAIIDARFASAVEHDHGGCGDTTCDIDAAIRAGYPRVAAYLLNGATETPTIDRVMHATGETFANMGFGTADDPDWLAWCQWFESNTLRCPSCEAFNFTDDGDPYSCGNCGASLGKAN
jgi:hypothetical protein